MQANQNQLLLKKKDENLIKPRQRPISAAPTRNDYNFRFNSKLIPPKKNSLLEVPQLYNANYGITNPYLLSIANLKKLNINNYGNLNIEKIFDKTLANSATNFFSSPKKPEEYNMNSMSQTQMLNRNNYPSLLLSSNNNQNKLNLNMNKFNIIKEGKNIEKEKLYDDNIKLKEKINLLNKEKVNLKSEIHKKDAEIIKINKLIQEYMTVSDGKLNNISSSLPNENNFLLNLNGINAGNNFSNANSKLLEKSNSNQLIYNLKKQYKELKKQHNDKCLEIENIKKNIKHTKVIELKMENQTFMDEIKNINKKMENYIEKIKIYEAVQNEYFLLLESNKKQTQLLTQLKEENLSYSQHIEVLNEKLSQQISKQDLIKELEKKTKKIEELETELKIRRNTGNPDEINSKNDLLREIVVKLRDPKFMIDSQSNKQIALNSFFKSKVEFFILELEKAEMENKKLREYVYLLENPNSSNLDKIRDNGFSQFNNTNKISSLNGSNKNYNDLPSTIELVDTKKNNNSYSVSSSINYLNEDQLKYFTYVLIKNFEVRKIDCNVLKDKIFGEDLINLSFDELAKYLEDQIITLLKVKNENDKNNVSLYTKSIVKYNKNDFNELKSSFIAFFDIIKIYSEQDEIKFRKKLIKKFRNHKADIIAAIEVFDQDKTGNISFLTFKQVLQNLNIRMKEKYTEYLIHIMKKNKEYSAGVHLTLEELRYMNVIKMLDTHNGENLSELSSSSEENELENLNDNEERAEDIAVNSGLQKSETEKNCDAHNKNDENETNREAESNNQLKKQSPSKAAAIFPVENNESFNLNHAMINSTDKMINLENNDIKKDNEKNLLEKPENPVAEEDEEEEVVITIEQFNERVDKILSKLAEFLISNKKTVKEFFCNYISIHNVTAYDCYDAITLKDFIMILQGLGVNLDTIDIYCIFTKLKYNDDYETIDVSKLLDEMLNYGIFEDNFKGFCNPILENQEENKEITENSISDKNMHKVNKSSNYNQSNIMEDQSENLIVINKELQNELLISLNNHLKMKNINFNDFIATKSVSIEYVNSGKSAKKLLKYQEFLNHCESLKIIKKDFQLDTKAKNMICEYENDISYVNLNKLSHCLERLEKEFDECEYIFNQENFKEEHKDPNYSKDNNIENEEKYGNEGFNEIQISGPNKINNNNKSNSQNNQEKKSTDSKFDDKSYYNKHKSQTKSISVKNKSINEQQNDIKKIMNREKSDLVIKAEMEKHQKSLNSSLNFDEIEDMELEGLD